MFLRFDACLNGVSFADLDPAIVLRDIIELPPVESKETYQRALHSGMMVGGMTRESLSVQLVFMVREYDISARARLMDKVAQWVGNGGWLTINSRPGQRLYVRPDEMPSMSSSLKWTDDMYMTLTAYESPFWEAETAATLAITTSATTINGYLKPVGTYPTAYVSCYITNTGSAALTQLNVRTPRSSIQLTGLNVPNGKTVSIGYSDDGILMITANGASALANRTASSADDLIATCNANNTVSATANVTIKATFTSRGRYW